MDKNKILLILEQLSENTLSCYLSYNKKTNVLDGINITGNSISEDYLNKEFSKYKVGTKCSIEKIVFQPKGRNFLVTIKNNIITCSKYADRNETSTVINTINKLLNG